MSVGALGVVSRPECGCDQLEECSPTCHVTRPLISIYICVYVLEPPNPVSHSLAFAP